MQTHRPLNPAAQAELARVSAEVAALPDHLLTPRMWAELALAEGLELAGTTEGAAKAAECKRYLACLEALARLAERCAELERQLQAQAVPSR